MPKEKEKAESGEISALATRHEGILDIEPTRARANLRAIKQFQAVVREVLTEGTDYGTIPGCGDKPSLFKPGAEKITKLLNLFEDYEFVERIEDFDKPLFHYVVRCTLRDIATGTRVASGLGSCNSRESKYRYRWIPETEISAAERVGLKKRGGKQTLFEFDFALSKRETTGQYGKPAEHWAAFDAAIAAGTARTTTRKTKKDKDLPGREIDVNAVFYQLENPEIFDQVNTILKMGKKRAHVDATLAAGRLSELFTQDLEDLADAGGPTLDPVGKPAEPLRAPAQSASPADIEKAKAQAAYEAGKKKPLGKPQDEWAGDPEADFPEGNGQSFGEEIGAVAGPEPAGQCTLKQQEKFAKAKAELHKMGISEDTLWLGVQKFTTQTYKLTFGELRDLTVEQLDGVLTYMGAWKKNLIDKRAAKAATEKARG